jgi:hypothetical protein
MVIPIAIGLFRVRIGGVSITITTFLDIIVKESTLGLDIILSNCSPDCTITQFLYFRTDSINFPKQLLTNNFQIFFLKSVLAATRLAVQKSIYGTKKFD